MLSNKYLNNKNQIKKNVLNLFIPTLFGVKNNKLNKTFYWESMYYKNFYLIFNNISLIEVFFKDKKIFYNFSKYFQFNLYIYLIKKNFIILNLFFHFFYMLFLTFENNEDIYTNKIFFKGYKQCSKHKRISKGWIKPDYNFKFYFNQRINSISLYVLNFNIYKNIYFSKYNLFLAETKFIYKLFYYFKMLQYKLQSFVILYKNHFKVEKKLRLIFAKINTFIYKNLNNKLIKLFSFYKIHLNINKKSNIANLTLLTNKEVKKKIQFEKKIVWPNSRRRYLMRKNAINDENNAINLFKEEKLNGFDFDPELFEILYSNHYFSLEDFDFFYNILIKFHWIKLFLDKKVFYLGTFYFVFYNFLFSTKFHATCYVSNLPLIFRNLLNMFHYDTINTFLINIFDINNSSSSNFFNNLNERDKETFINYIYNQTGFNSLIHSIEFFLVYNFSKFYTNVREVFEHFLEDDFGDFFVVKHMKSMFRRMKKHYILFPMDQKKYSDIELIEKARLLLVKKYFKDRYRLVSRYTLRQKLYKDNYYYDSEEHYYQKYTKEDCYFTNIVFFRNYHKKKYHLKKGVSVNYLFNLLKKKKEKKSKVYLLKLLSKKLFKSNIINFNLNMSEINNIISFFLKRKKNNIILKKINLNKINSTKILAFKDILKFKTKYFFLKNTRKLYSKKNYIFKTKKKKIINYKKKLIIYYNKQFSDAIKYKLYNFAIKILKKIKKIEKKLNKLIVRKKNKIKKKKKKIKKSILFKQKLLNRKKSYRTFNNKSLKKMAVKERFNSYKQLVTKPKYKESSDIIMHLNEFNNKQKTSIIVYNSNEILSNNKHRKINSSVIFPLKKNKLIKFHKNLLRIKLKNLKRKSIRVKQRATKFSYIYRHRSQKLEKKNKKNKIKKIIKFKKNIKEKKDYYIKKKKIRKLIVKTKFFKIFGQKKYSKKKYNLKKLFSIFEKSFLKKKRKLNKNTYNINIYKRISQKNSNKIIRRKIINEKNRIKKKKKKRKLLKKLSKIKRNNKISKRKRFRRKNRRFRILNKLYYSLKDKKIIFKSFYFKSPIEKENFYYFLTRKKKLRLKYFKRSKIRKFQNAFFENFRRYRSNCSLVSLKRIKSLKFNKFNKSFISLKQIYKRWKLELINERKKKREENISLFSANKKRWFYRKLLFLKKYNFFKSKKIRIGINKNLKKLKFDTNNNLESVFNTKKLNLIKFNLNKFKSLIIKLNKLRKQKIFKVENKFKFLNEKLINKKVYLFKYLKYLVYVYNKLIVNKNNFNLENNLLLIKKLINLLKFNIKLINFNRLKNKISIKRKYSFKKKPIIFNESFNTNFYNYKFFNLSKKLFSYYSFLNNKKFLNNKFQFSKQLKLFARSNNLKRTMNFKIKYKKFLKYKCKKIMRERNKHFFYQKYKPKGNFRLIYFKKLRLYKKIYNNIKNKGLIKKLLKSHSKHSKINKNILFILKSLKKLGEKINQSKDLKKIRYYKKLKLKLKEKLKKQLKKTIKNLIIKNKKNDNILLNNVGFKLKKYLKKKLLNKYRKINKKKKSIIIRDKIIKKNTKGLRKFLKKHPLIPRKKTYYQRIRESEEYYKRKFFLQDLERKKFWYLKRKKKGRLTKRELKKERIILTLKKRKIKLQKEKIKKILNLTKNLKQKKQIKLYVLNLLKLKYYNKKKRKNKKLKKNKITIYNKYLFYFKLLLKTRLKLFKNKNNFNFLFLNKLKLLIKNILFKTKTSYYNLITNSFNKNNFYTEYKLWFLHYKKFKKIPFKLICLYSKFYFNKFLYNLKLRSNFLIFYNNYLKARTKIKYFNTKQSNKYFKKKKIKKLFQIIFYNVFRKYIKYFISPRKVIFSLIKNGSVFMYYKLHETPRKDFKNINTTISFFLQDLKKKRSFYVSKYIRYKSFFFVYWAKKFYSHYVYGDSKGKFAEFHLLSYYFKFFKSKTFFFNYLINFIFIYIQKVNLNLLNYIFILNQYKTKLVIESNNFYKYLLLFYFKKSHYKNFVKQFNYIIPINYSYFSMFFKQLSLELINWYTIVNNSYTNEYRSTFLFNLCFVNHNTMAIYLYYKYKYLYYYRVYSFYIFYIFYYLYNHLFKVYTKLKLKDFKLTYDLIKYNEYNRYYLGLRTRMLILTIRNRYKRGFTVEKIFRSIKFFLRESMKKKELAGYYISIRGRYKRSSRSNKLIIKNGVYSFNKIDLKVDSSYGTLNTKFGIAGIKVIFAFK